jgi:hypothetical protein
LIIRREREIKGIVLTVNYVSLLDFSISQLSFPNKFKDIQNLYKYKINIESL